MAYYYKSVIVAIIVSLCALPCIRAGLSHPQMSMLIPMYLLNYALIISASVFFLIILPPNICSDKPFKRNEIYYGCCIFMCMCLGSATLQSWRLKKFGAQKVKHKIEFFAYDELYVLTPFGMSTEIWRDIINYCFYALIIFSIDNNKPYRDVALYWSGGTLTGELVATIASFTGSNSHQLKYSELLHIVYIGAATWVIFKFLVLKPRYIEKSTFMTEYRNWDKVLSILLIFLSGFAGLRGLGALSGNQRLVKSYVNFFEPSILHPSKFGVIWILYTAVYGIPFQLATVYALTGPGSQWLVDLSILYAASVLQGTFVFASYSMFPSADGKFRIPSSSKGIVYVLNALLVIVAHILMYRCLIEQSYFHKRCLKIKTHPPNHSDSDDSDC